MNRGYISALAAVAVAILVGGSLFRPKQPAIVHTPAANLRETPVPAPVPPAQTRRGQMRQMGEFVSERTIEASRHVVYVPAARASGIVWHGGNVVSITRDGSMVQLATLAPPSESMPARPSSADRISQSTWVVVVGRTEDGRTISASGMLGGTVDAKCRDQSVRKLLSNVNTGEEFAGGGVFDISGDLVGMVVRCNNSWVAVTHSDVDRLLSARPTGDARVWQSFGVRARDPNDAEKKHLRLRDGVLLITEVRSDGGAAAIGLMPGDALLSTPGNATEQPEESTGDGETVTIWRNGKVNVLPVTPPWSFAPAGAGVTLASVKTGSRLHEAGLRAGDRIERSESKTDVTAGELTRVLEKKTPLWLVYRRDDRYVGVLLP